MAEALKTFKEGEDILASETNANNQYLLSKLSDNAAQVQSYVESEVATIKSNVASVQATLQNNIDAIAAQMLVGVITQKNGGSIKLTDSATEKSVIIQYGKVTGMGNKTSKLVSLSVPFTNTEYAIAGAATCAQYAGDKGSTWFVKNLTTSTFEIESRFENQSGHTIWWIAVGY